jgi:hypothetical protein
MFFRNSAIAPICKSRSTAADGTFLAMRRISLTKRRPLVHAIRLPGMNWPRYQNSLTEQKCHNEVDCRDCCTVPASF